MNAGTWQLVSTLFARALESAPAERATLLAAAGAEVRAEVESLLSAHEATGPVDRLVAEATELRGALATSTGSGEAPEAPGRLVPGQRLGRYELGSHLGAGGMGEVYRAFDPRLRREVAIKVLHRRGQRRPGALRRFEEEARAASALNHPHIVTVHDLGEEPLPHIVMELVDGPSLRRALEAPLPVECLLGWAVQLADGLAAAHERQMVHGDVKPENILVSARGTAKLVDFGLARFRSREDAAGGGTLLGTPGYLSPEAIAGEPVDHRSDQFSLGAVLYEMATGARAFAGQDVLEVLVSTRFHEPAPLAAARPDLPPAFARAVERCLRKDRDERYPSTRALLEELRAAGRGPGLRPAVPASRTRLIGRERELDALERLVGPVRLVTLTGPGGTGKTRLALSCAERVAPRFPGGIAFVPLAAVSDPALVAPAIAQALGAAVGQPLAAAIEALQDVGPALLVLDNFEQVVGAGAAVGELLAACPDLAILVTSREVLRVYGEQVFPVSALALPDPERLPGPAELGRCPAVALFVERAQAADPRFALDADNAADVAALCAGLEGLPLALELAAAQTRSLPVPSLRARLDDRLGLLTGGARDLPGRQQTLRRTLDWSHQLLAPLEQALFRRLAVFAGGFTTEAAQAVADPYGKLGLPAGEGIAALVDKSLLQPREPGPGGEARFGMLETIREYAREKLAAAGEGPRTSEAHAAYFLVLGEEGAEAVASADSLWLRRFQTEYDNFRAAVEWLTGQGRAAWGLRLALALFPLWQRGEHLAEGRRRLDELLARAGTAAAPALQARALFAAGVLASDQSDVVAGAVHHGRCLALHRQLGDRLGVAISLVALGNQLVAAGDHEEARSLLEESLQLWRALGDDAGFARSLSNLAAVARAQGRRAEARSLYRKAAAVFERLSEPLSHAWALNHEGDVAREDDDLDGAHALYQVALAMFRSLEDGWGIAASLTDLGTIARLRQDLGAARRCYEESLETFVRLDHRRGIARLLECLAVLCGEEGRPERALRLAATASSMRERVGGGIPREPRDDVERSLTAVHRQVGAAAGRLWHEGAAMPVAEALRLAVSN